MAADSAPSPSVPSSSAPGQPPAPHLRRVLGLRDLVLYGIVLIQPVGAIGPFGLANQQSFGHVTLTILIALVAMMLTAVCYGRMAGLYPAAGSAYTYVGRGLNPYAGFFAGWAMILDYLVIPIVSIVFGALSTQRFIDDLAPNLTPAIVSALGLPFPPAKVGYYLWIILFVVLVTFLNLRGIKWTARANEIMAVVMFLLIGVFVVQAVRYLLRTQGLAGLFSFEPFYNPRTFNLGSIGTATSLAALTYIGFDGITTLAEDTREPKRTVPLAVVLTCAIIGVCAFVLVYLGQRVWPDYSTYKDVDTAFFDVCKLVGGTFLFEGVAIVMAVACVGSALTGQVGAARVLFGMGRDQALPSFFSRLDSRNNPYLSIWLTGIVILLVALFLTYGDAASLINFGAFLAFLGVNLAAIREFVFRPPPGHRRNWLMDLVIPLLAFVFCLVIWLKLKWIAFGLGMAWCAIGLIYTAIKTRFFRDTPQMIDLNA